jgi:hypothetical protein
MIYYSTLDLRIFLRKENIDTFIIYIVKNKKDKVLYENILFVRILSCMKSVLNVVLFPREMTVMDFLSGLISRTSIARLDSAPRQTVKFVISTD